MAFTLGDAITAARDVHPAFHPRQTPNGPAARWATAYQRTLIAKMALMDPTALQQTAVIALAVDLANAVGTAGAGTTGGVPGSVAADGSVSAVEAPAGLALEASDSAAILVAERGIASATSTGLTDAGAPGWTTNGYAGREVVFTAGPAIGERRVILSNTASALAWTDALATVPTTATRYRIESPTTDATETFGVVTALPQTATRRGWLVKTTSAGVPFLDYASPLVASYGVGVPLPPSSALVDGTVYGASGPLGRVTFVPWAERFNVTSPYAVAEAGDALTLCGTATDWAGVVSLELRYAPVPPAFTALADVFLLPDAAFGAVRAQLAAFFGGRVAGLSDSVLDVGTAGRLAAEGVDAERAYLTSVAGRRRGRTQTITAWEP